MKRFVYVMILVALALALLPGAALAHPCSAPAQYPLYAGQTMLVGYVYVCSDGSSLTVTYDTSSTGWLISETHLAVGDQLNDIPQRNGNPPPGQFPYKSYHDPYVTTVSYSIPKSAIGPIDVGDTVYIAAHAVVWDPNSGGGSGTILVCSDGNETYTAYNNFVLGDDAGTITGNTPVRAGMAYPSAEPYGEQFDAVPSAWDDGVGAPFAGGSACADWIWEENLMEVDGVVINQVVNPVHGDRVEFTDTFDLPPADSYSGTLYVSCDNAYEAYVNTTTPGNPLLWGQLGNVPNDPPYPEGPYPGPGWWTSDLYETSVNTDGWQSVESAPLTGLSQGPNYLFFRAANEYMAPDDQFNPTAGNARIIDVYPEPYAFVPSAYINPAGIIWQAEINYYNEPDRDETAWGAQGPGPGGNPFPGKNWATYIMYEWQ